MLATIKTVSLICRLKPERLWLVSAKPAFSGDLNTETSNTQTLEVAAFNYR